MANAAAQKLFLLERYRKQYPELDHDTTITPHSFVDEITHELLRLQEQIERIREEKEKQSLLLHLRTLSLILAQNEKALNKK